MTTTNKWAQLDTEPGFIKRPTYTSERLRALADALAIFPEHGATELMEIVDWAPDDTTGLDPQALEVAAKALARADGSEWTGSTSVPNKYRGLVAHTIATYLAATK